MIRSQNIGKRTAKRGLAAFLRREDGAAAVEFALVIGPLILMIFACIELALVIILSVTLDNATEAAAREIRTGIMTGANSSVNTFRQKVCTNMGWLQAGCNASLRVDVKTYDSFSQVPTTDLIKDGEFDNTQFTYNIGAGSKIQMVRAYFQWPLFTPLLNGGLSTLSNGDAVVSAKVVFRNEPF